MTWTRQQSVGVSNITIEEFTPTLVELADPYDVTDLKVTNRNKNSINLSWKPSTSSDVTNYLIYNGTNLLGVVAYTELSVAILSLLSATNYTFTVKARDADGNLSYGTNVSTKTAGLYMLSMPGTIGNYLKLNGVEFSSVEMEVTFKPKQNSWDNTVLQPETSNGSVFFEFNGVNISSAGGLFTKFFLDGTKLSGTYMQTVPLNTQKIAFRMTRDTNIIDDLFIFRAKSATDPRNLAAEIHQIKIYRKDIFGGDYVVSEYDFTTIAVGGTVPDLNGVSNPITIFGGSFILS